MVSLPVPELFVLTLFFGLVGLAAAWDAAEFRIPNTLCLAIAALYPAYAIGSARTPDWPVAAAIAAAVLVIGVTLFHLGFLGGGDVKLLAAVALWAGPGAIAELLLIMALAGGAIGVAVILARSAAGSLVLFRLGAGGLVPADARPKVPYAVAIAAGVFIAVGPRLLGPG